MIVDTDVLMIIMGDFSANAQANLQSIQDIIKTIQFGLCAYAIANTYIDLTFATNITVNLMSCVS